MLRQSLLILILLLPAAARAGEATGTALPVIPPPVAVATLPEPVLPPMWFASSLSEEQVLAQLKAHPALAGLDTKLSGSPLSLLVTHTYEATPGGQAAGLVTGLLSASTLGIIPMVSNNRLVVRYEVILNGRIITSHAFERTATRAQNLWVSGNGQEGQLGKAGLEWAMSTVDEAAERLAHDPVLHAVRQDMEFYFPSGTDTAGAP